MRRAGPHGFGADRGRSRRVGLQALAIVLACLVGAAASHAAIPPSAFTDLAFTQHPGGQLPREARLRDETGHSVSLSGFFDRGPVILVFEYLRCPNLCGTVLGGLFEGLAGSKLAPADYQVLAISIDPTEGPDQAATARASYAERYGSAVSRWSFLTGDEAEVRRVADAAGFGYRFDPAIGQYAHAAGLVVATPDATVSRYLLGVDPSPLDLRLALTEAGLGTIAGPAAHLLLLCYDYDPATGSYTPAVMRLLRWAGVLTLLVGGSLLARQVRRETRG